MFKTVSAFLLVTFLLSTTACQSRAKQFDPGKTDSTVFSLAENLLISAKEKKDATEWWDKLAQLDQDILLNTLNTDDKKKAFWMNVYNATVQLLLEKNPELFEDRGEFFGKDRIVIAGVNLSLDKIEHGIIRGSKLKLSLGLIKNPFADRFEKESRVDKTDGRIHFALNCGAKSCPYVAIYDYRKTDEQLEKGAAQYLQKTTLVEGETAKVSTLFNWFRGDFGSKKDVVKLNKRLGAIDKNAQIKNLEYLPYDWTLELGNYKEL